jgi:DNA-directed RNA polymerase subunit M/transcription elongation factor TFIIS
LSFSFSFALIACPACGEMIMPYGTQIGKDPEFWTTQCPHCKKMIEVRRDSVSGKLIAKKAKPS